jgi:hypothetical protein
VVSIVNGLLLFNPYNILFGKPGNVPVWLMGAVLDRIDCFHNHQHQYSSSNRHNDEVIAAVLASMSWLLFQNHLSSDNVKEHVLQ